MNHRALLSGLIY